MDFKIISAVKFSFEPEIGWNVFNHFLEIDEY